MHCSPDVADRHHRRALPQGNTSRRQAGRAVFLHQQRGVAITLPNQVCAMDITCLPMKRGFVYL